MKFDQIIFETKKRLNLFRDLPFGPLPASCELDDDAIWAMTDLTLLKPEATPAQIEALCRHAIDVGAATVCVNPYYVSLAANMLKNSAVKPISVVGFPLGAGSLEGVASEARRAVLDGAREIDMVIPAGRLKAGFNDSVSSYIRRIVIEVEDDAPVKVILETSLLTEEEIIRASLLSVAAGATFVKTSTGFGTAGATAENVALMRRTVGAKFGVKASGGIRTFEQARAMIAAGATRIGASSLS